MPGPVAVTASSGSAPARTPSRIAASRTVRVIGPAVSWLCAIGTMPRRLTRPSVGLIPTSAAAEDGHTTEPWGSVPTRTAGTPAAGVAVVSLAQGALAPRSGCVDAALHAGLQLIDGRLAQLERWDGGAWGRGRCGTQRSGTDRGRQPTERRRVEEFATIECHEA